MIDDPSAWQIQRLGAHRRRNPTPLVPIAVTATRFSPLVAPRAQSLGHLFLEHELRGLEDPMTHRLLDALAEAQHLRLSRVSF